MEKPKFSSKSDHVISETGSKSPEAFKFWRVISYGLFWIMVILLLAAFIIEFLERLLRHFG